MGDLNFQEAVIGRSYEKPVVVDFWAPWCGPCRVLGPVIEQLATEQPDRWELVKVNTEEEFELAQEYQIKSIPNVKLFHRGKVIAEFLGALPRHQIEQWLSEHLPDERKKDLEALLEQFRNGDADEALVGKLEALVAENPDLTEARVALAGHLVREEPESARQLLSDIKLGDEFYDEAENIRTLARFLAFEPAGQSPAAPLLAEARSAFRTGDEEAAIQKVIEATTADKTIEEDLPRKTAIALFQHWGEQHPLTKQYRWRFDMALY